MFLLRGGEAGAVGEGVGGGCGDREGALGGRVPFAGGRRGRRGQRGGEAGLAGCREGGFGSGERRVCVTFRRAGGDRIGGGRVGFGGGLGQAGVLGGKRRWAVGSEAGELGHRLGGAGLGGCAAVGEDSESGDVGDAGRGERGAEGRFGLGGIGGGAGGVAAGGEGEAAEAG